MSKAHNQNETFQASGEDSDKHYTYRIPKLVGGLAVSGLLVFSALESDPTELPTSFANVMAVAGIAVGTAAIDMAIKREDEEQ